MERHVTRWRTGMPVGPYRLERPLGRGGMASVWLAVDASGERRALKLRRLQDDLLDGRFLREIACHRAPDVSGLVPVLRWGIQDDVAWYAMPRIDGLPLDRWIQAASTRGSRETRARRAGAQLFRVLAALHERGLVHRDLKAENILVDGEGRVHVIDLGVARWTALDAARTSHGTLVGTAATMAPEQAARWPVQPASDVFSAALVLWRALLGRPPASGSARRQLLLRVLEPIAPLWTVDPHACPDLSAILESCMAFFPGLRPEPGVVAERLEDSPTQPHDWPAPPRFHGREEELERLEAALVRREVAAIVVEGPVGSGRRRLVEQACRMALLEGRWPVRVVARRAEPGSVVRDILQALLETPPFSDWPDALDARTTHALRCTWPELAVGGDPPPPDATRPTIARVAEAVSRALARAAAGGGLLLHVEGLEDLPDLDRRILERLFADGAAPAAPLVATLDPRRAPSAVRRFLEGLERGGHLARLRPGPLGAAEATAIAVDLSGDASVPVVPACQPAAAVLAGWRHLSRRTGRPPPRPGPEAAILAFADGTLPQPVVDRLPAAPGMLARMRSGDRRWAGPNLQRAAAAIEEDPNHAHHVLAQAWAQAALPDSLDRAARHLLHVVEAPWAHVADAALEAAATGRLGVARSWLLLLDECTPDRGARAYRLRRFGVAWLRALTALRTEAGPPRRDLVEVVPGRAATPTERLDLDILLVHYQLRLGRLEAATARALRHAARCDDPLRRAALLALAAEGHLASGRLRSALQAAEQAERALGGHRHPVAEAWKVLALVLEGRHALARRSGTPLAHAPDPPDLAAAVLAGTALARSLLDEGEQAAAHAAWLRAGARLREVGRLEILAGHALVGARLHLARGELHAARRLAARAGLLADILARPRLVREHRVLAHEVAAQTLAPPPSPHPADEHPRVRAARARALALRGEIEEATRACAALPRDLPESAEALLATARGLLVEGAADAEIARWAAAAGHAARHAERPATTRQARLLEKLVRGGIEEADLDAARQERSIHGATLALEVEAIHRARRGDPVGARDTCRALVALAAELGLAAGRARAQRLAERLGAPPAPPRPAGAGQPTGR